MGIIEAIALIILVLAILILVYYYIQNNPLIADKVKSFVPSSQGEGGLDYSNLNFQDDIPDAFEDESESMGKKIKIKLSDIDMSSFNTDVFSKKIDSFLDEKSEELINDWELATKNDLEVFEDRLTNTSQSINSLEERFNSFKDDSNQKFDDFENRIKNLENQE